MRASRREHPHRAGPALQLSVGALPHAAGAQAPVVRIGDESESESESESAPVWLTLYVPVRHDLPIGGNGGGDGWQTQAHARVQAARGGPVPRVGHRLLLMCNKKWSECASEFELCAH